MRKFDLSLRSSRSSYFATFRHQLSILSKTVASFPTRRSSDLAGRRLRAGVEASDPRRYAGRHHGGPVASGVRSEEHTSELQSRVDFVCRLLLEKKNSDISDESKNYLNKAGITTACLRIKSKLTAGGK